MTVSKKIRVLLIAFVLSIIFLPGRCESTITVGSETFPISEDTPILHPTENSISVSVGHSDGDRTIAVNLIFQELADQIQVGAEFDVVSGIGGEDGKVTINLSDEDASPQKTVTTDGFSKARGKIRILSFDEITGSFTFSIDATVSNLSTLSVKSNGKIVSKRVKKKVGISGTIDALDVGL